jgi:hypothetical protein
MELEEQGKNFFRQGSKVKMKKNEIRSIRYFSWFMVTRFILYRTGGIWYCDRGNTFVGRYCTWQLIGLLAVISAGCYICCCIGCCLAVCLTAARTLASKVLRGYCGSTIAAPVPHHHRCIAAVVGR